MLRRTDRGEADRRLVLLTREAGKLDAIARGARKAGSRLSGASEPLTLSRFQLSQAARARFVAQVVPVDAFAGLRGDYDRLMIALALAEAVEAITPYDQPRPEEFDALVEALEQIERHPKPTVALVWAELRLLEAEGIPTTWTRCAVTGVPLERARELVSATAGGFVAETAANGYRDLHWVDAEILIGLQKTGDLAQPPPNLRRAPECLGVLADFIRDYAQCALPAQDALLRHLEHA